ncbi:hypothetical protein J2W24_005498 [Variovorax boronicumulans]|uniref:hypothetical protein n=1 Tax=Variovorax boronicumulans TaxID=436515 RepID=UPI002788B4F7|nr:hypothetical protein [Variovorax boronicumulans]MDP9919818.1 hypothetical protein [Variovorax boronicumulans]
MDEVPFNSADAKPTESRVYEISVPHSGFAFFNVAKRQWSKPYRDAEGAKHFMHRKAVFQAVHWREIQPEAGA